MSVYKKKPLRPAVFLDRDGTLLTERGYLSDPKKIFFYDGVVAALKNLRRNGFRLVIVTNQSGVGRGYFTLATLHQVNRRFTDLLKKRGVRIDGIYFCPHHPEAGCACRKPQPTLARRAAREIKIDLKRSYVVGDQVGDLKLARNLGVPGVFVLTGSGRLQRKSAASIASKVTSNMATAARWILSRL